MNRTDLDRWITGNYGEDQFAEEPKAYGRDDAPEGCSHRACNMDAEPYSDLCAYHLERNVFARIAQRNHALASMLNSANSDAVRKAAMEIAFRKGGAGMIRLTIAALALTATLAGCSINPVTDCPNGITYTDWCGCEPPLYGDDC